MIRRRRQARRQVRPARLLWRVTYGNEERVGVGIVLAMHKTDCHIAGRMRVKTGMRLWLCLWPSQSPEEMCETAGIVTWTKGPQFGLVLDTPPGMRNIFC